MSQAALFVVFRVCHGISGFRCVLGGLGVSLVCDGVLSWVGMVDTEVSSSFTKIASV